MSDWVRYWEREGRRWYIGVALLPYQITLGVTLRWYDGQPHTRIYVGPFKAYAGRKRKGQVVYSGGDR